MSITNDYVTCTLRSLSPAPLRVLARAAAERWGADPVLAPDRAGFSERTKMLRRETLVDRLDAAWADERELDDLWLYLERPDVDLVGDMRFVADVGDTSDQNLQFSFAADRVDDLGPVVDLAADLFVAIDGYYGSIDTVSTGAHRFELAREGGARGAVPRLAAGDSSTYRFEHVLDGPWWVNLYGPAFVTRWGDAMVDELGVERRRLANGGVLVMTAEAPVAVDPSIDDLLGHPHQRRLVEQLGADMFLHETGTAEFPAAGLHVPSRADHRSAAVTSRDQG